MTTQTRLSETVQVVPTIAKSKIRIIPWVILALIIIALVAVVFAVSPALNSKSETNMKALEAVSARYQGMADSYYAMQELNSQKALESISAHYQGLANLYGAELVTDSQKALESISARYQGQADLIAAKRQSDSQKALESISAHYQGLADLYLGGE
jgi:uncharacterized lipoprotein YehR (DUF1307 family)